VAALPQADPLARDRHRVVRIVEASHPLVPTENRGVRNPRSGGSVYLADTQNHAPSRTFPLRGKALGHSDPGFTLKTYVHLLPEDMPEVPFGLTPVAPLCAVAS
jgi:hypothetical protein